MRDGTLNRLIQLIYCSTSTHSIDRNELDELLLTARRNNARCGITGMLLYSERSFFQVLEGEESTVEILFESIIRDPRHAKVTEIIREPIVNRSFGNWTMGYADIAPQELDSLVGSNDFFGKGQSFAHLGQGRAKKLLAAFKDGRWRANLTGSVNLGDEVPKKLAAPPDISPQTSSRTGYTFAFQPIINTAKREIFSYEALIRGVGNEPAGHVLRHIDPSQLHHFDAQARITAVEMATRLGLTARLNLNFLPTSLESLPTAITSMLSAAKRGNIGAGQLVLEILEREIIHDIDAFVSAVSEYRRSGLTFAIDDFGAGYAGLNLLARFQPDIVKLDMILVRGIERHGPRQAIVRGIARTCTDLGIDIIAEGVETTDEYQWLHEEGIELFQGMLFASPAFEQLSTAFYIP